MLSDSQESDVWLEEGNGHQRKLLEGNGIDVGLDGHVGFRSGGQIYCREGPGRQKSLLWITEVTSLTVVLGIRLEQPRCMVGGSGTAGEGLARGTGY